MVRLLVAVIILSILPAMAADFHSEAATLMNAPIGERWSGALYVRGRVNTRTGRWYDISASPFVTCHLRSYLSISGGVFVTRFHFPETGATAIVRPYASVDPALKLGRTTLDARSRVERFIISNGLADRTRFRQRFGITRSAGSWTPYGQIEFFFTPEGFTVTRYAAGVQKRVWGGHGVEISYFYEASGLTGPGIRHMIRTTLHLHFGAFPHPAGHPTPRQIFAIR